MKIHIPALILAFIVGLIVVGPQIFFVHSLGEDYQGLYMMKSDAESHYLARMRETCESGSIGNPYTKEYRDVYPSALHTYSEKILAAPACVLGVSIPSINLFYKFFLSFLLTLLVYWLLWRLTGSLLWSLAGASLVMLGNPLVNLPDIKNFVIGHLVYDQFTLYARPVNPEFSSLFFFGYLHILLSIFRKPSRKLYLLLGLILGVSFYIYFYLFTFLLAATVIALIFKRGFAQSLVIGVCLGTPALLVLYQLAHHPWYAGIANEYALTPTHMPILSLAWLAVAALTAIYWYRTRDKSPEMSFVFLALLTALAVVNTQVITGSSLQAGHYHWYFNSPIFIIIVIFIFSRALSVAKQNLRQILCCSLILLSFAIGSFIQFSSYENNYNLVASEQRLVPALAWLSREVKEPSIILANRELSQLVPIFSQHFVVWSPSAAGYLLPPKWRGFTPSALATAEYVIEVRGEKERILLPGKKLNLVYSYLDVAIYKVEN